MKSLWREANEFFASTSIHGFPYINNSHVRSTRIIWTIIVAGALGAASYFLYQTVDGFYDKYVSTTIETRSIKEFPFPAVTFDPGDFNSKKGFLRTFLNQFEFTRYEKNSPLKDNGNFSKLYEWLVTPMGTQLFDDVEEFLINDKPENHESHKTFIQDKGGMFRNEVCTLISLHIRKVCMKKEIRSVFQDNMYKFKYFNYLKNFIKNEISPRIEETFKKYNMTKKDVYAACKDKKNAEIKKKMEAMLLSYMFIFIDRMNNDVGAGDIVTEGPYFTGLARKDQKHPFPTYYVTTNILVTNMYNDMVNATLPLSVLEFPMFFVMQDKFFEWANKFRIKGYNNMLELLNFTDEGFRNYHYLWYTYNENFENFTLVCINDKNTNCSKDPLKFGLVNNEKDGIFFRGMATHVRRNPELGMLLEGVVTSPPCTDNEINRKFKISPICNFMENIFNNKDGFLKLMKFTKQNPVFLEEDSEYYSVFPKLNISLHGYNLKKDKVKCLLMIVDI